MGKKLKPRLEHLGSKSIPPTGRPRGWPAKPLYRSEYCAVVRELGSLGWSEAMMAQHLNISRRGMRQWGEVHEEFGEALEESRDLALAWWERKGQRSLTRAGFNTALYNKIIGCRFRNEYSERTVLAGDPAAPLHTVTEVRRTIVRPDAT